MGFAVFICLWRQEVGYVVIGVGMQEHGLMSYIDMTEFGKRNWLWNIMGFICDKFILWSIVGFLAKHVLDCDPASQNSCRSYGV